MYITKINNEPSTLDPYIEKVWFFMGSVISLGNSIILLLSVFFDKKGFKRIDSGMLGPYINQLEKAKIDRVLIDYLRKYNKYLILVKHSIFVADEQLIKNNNTTIKLQDITTKEIQTFDQSSQENITKLASLIIAKVRILLN